MFENFGRVNFSPHSKVAEFAEHLERGKLMATRCTECGYQSFPPRSDCPECLSGEFEFVELSGAGTVVTFTQIVAAPAGFGEHAPYTIGVVDLEEGGRLLAWFNDSIDVEDVAIGMEVQVVPLTFETADGTRTTLELNKA